MVSFILMMEMKGNRVLYSIPQFYYNLYENYINLRLPKEYYRCFDSKSLYKHNKINFYLSNIDNIEDIDINYNLFLLRELWSILLELYSIKRKV